MQTDSPFDFEELDAREVENSIPGEGNARAPFSPVILWLGVLGLVILFIPLQLTANSLSDEISRLEADLLPWQTALTATPGALPGAQDLFVTLTAVHGQTEQMQAILPTLAAENMDWQAVMTAINSPTPPPPLPTATATFAATSTAVPTKTPTRIMPTRTPTPKLTDDFEWDDNHAKPIFVGAPAQAHNFYPNFDVDCVVFLAKAGRTYEVRTDFLAPGVDTFLTVTFGDVTLTNDDAELGTLSSSVTLQAPPESDVDVLVHITNRGVYGADKWYDLQVVEVVPTTPTPTVTPTTAPPTVTPSPTQDLRDSYEPNNIDPNPIAIGEAQIHNFYPDGDLDKVGFLVKNGRFYQILTSQLGVGVDTALTVAFNGETWTNDDYDLPGSGNFASAVCFPAEVDGTAVASISNVTQQFDPSRTYIVSVQEVPFLTVDPETIAFGTVLEGSGLLTQTVQIEGTEPLAWDVTTETSWLTTDVITGTTPAMLTIFVETADLDTGTHEGEITIGWADFCRQTIPVTIQIDPSRSELPLGHGRFLSGAKVANLQNETVEFVIVATLNTVAP